MKLQLCNEKQSPNISPTWHQNCFLWSLPLGQTPECWDPLRTYNQVEIQEKFQQNISSLPGHSNIWIELSDLILAIRLQRLICHFNLAFIFQRMTKGSPLLLNSEVITYYPDSLIYSTDTYWRQAVCPNYLELLIQHLHLSSSNVIQTEYRPIGYSLYRLKPSSTLAQQERWGSFSLILINKGPSGVQTHILLSVPALTLPPLCCGKGGEDHFHSYPHLNSLRSHCHHYTEVYSLCICLQSKSGKAERHCVSHARFPFFLKLSNIL